MSSPAWIRVCRPIPHLEIPQHNCGVYARGPVLLGDPALFSPPIQIPPRPSLPRNFVTVTMEADIAFRTRAYALDADDASICRIIASIDRAIREILPFDLVGRDAARKSMIREFGSRPDFDRHSAMVPALKSLGASRCIQTLIEELLGVFLARCPKGFPNA